jgi:catechol 2,3-dioxygenase-like lactoylglutathione lyase family enzyme
MPKMRHIAIATKDPEKTAAFYKAAFDFKEVGRAGGLLADGVFLSDGTLNLAILKFKTDQLGKGMDYTGVHHFGVLVEDVEAMTKKLESIGGERYIDRAAGGNNGYFEVKFYGPDGTLFDIAEHAWVGAEPLPVEAEQAEAAE